MQKVLKGYYQFQYATGTNCVYILKDPVLTMSTDGIWNGLRSEYAFDGHPRFTPGGYFPFDNMKLFRKMGKRFQPFKKKAKA
jgi:hypothetical protein